MKNEMIKGQYYYVEHKYDDGGIFWMIGRCNGDVKENGSRGDSKATAITSGETLHKSNWCYKDHNRTFRPATEEEIKWLDACIKADKYLTKEEVMKQQKTITFTPEQQQATIDMACASWQSVLAKEFGETIALRKPKGVTEERFKEYLDASTSEQLSKFKKMFPEYFQPDIKQGQLVYVKFADNSWYMRYFSHFDKGVMYVFINQQKSGSTSKAMQYSLTNPLL